MSVPRIAAVHDLSAYGRCSLTVIMPTLSAMGVQCCPLLTAYLSTHTGGFEGNTFLDLTEQIKLVAAHWRQLNLTFDGIYTGFMGSAAQITHTAEFIRTFQNPACTVLIDPVMGDHGKPYRTYTPEMCRKMTELSALADIITPNRTEAAVLLGKEYAALRLDREEDCRRWAEELSAHGARSVVLKGVSLHPNWAGAVCFDRETGAVSYADAPRTPGEFHGTGDLFASVISGALARGWRLAEAAQLAAEFVSQCTAAQGSPCRDGLEFEPLLWRLGQRMEEGKCRS